jgi:ketosteroid isomerase-like protein
MKKSLLILAALSCFSIGFADNVQVVRKALDANYKTVSAALKGNKIDKVAALLTDDYIVVEKGGQQMNKSQVITQFRGLAGQLQNTKWQRTIKSVTLNGNQAIAIVDGKFSGDVKAQDGKVHSLTQNATTKDTWIKTAKGYRLQRSEVQKNSMAMDGKVLPQPGG